MDHPSQTLEDLNFLATHQDLDLAILFGSLASGRTHRDSDLDIAIYPNRPLSPTDLAALSDQLALATGRPVDLVDLSRINGALLRQILRKGIVIFSKKPGTLGILAERLLDWQSDFEPAYQQILAAKRQRFLANAHGH
jgi:predicted nucleotidyltransferase